MKTELKLKTAGKNDVDNIINFLLKQSLDYPGYTKWVEKTGKEIYSGNKKGILACNNEELVAGIIYQRHKVFQQVIEIKNIRVNPEYRNKGLASKMLEKLEESVRKNFEAIVIDMRKSQVGLMNLLKKLDYRLIAEKRLYDNHLDIILMKILRKEEEKNITKAVRTYFS